MSDIPIGAAGTRGEAMTQPTNRWRASKKGGDHLDQYMAGRVTAGQSGGRTPLWPGIVAAVAAAVTAAAMLVNVIHQLVH